MTCTSSCIDHPFGAKIQPIFGQCTAVTSFMRLMHNTTIQHVKFWYLQEQTQGPCSGISAVTRPPPPFLSQQEGHLTGIKYKNPELNLSEWPGPYCIHINSLKSSFFAGAIPVKYRVYVQFWLCNYHLVDVAQNFSGAPPSV